MSVIFKKQDYIDYIKLQLTGGVIELEISDDIIGKYVDQALLEIRRYIDQEKFVTVPFAKCIDLTDFNHSAITNVYRTQGFTGDTMQTNSMSDVDPMYAQQWLAFSSGGTVYNLKSYIMNYVSYNTLLQMQNTTTTDMAFKEDKTANKLYINCNYDMPPYVTIAYIPVYESVEEINSDYWVDILRRLSLALTKIGLGRVRTRFTQSNALWTQDGETMLQEGNEELKELRETLRSNALYFFPKD